MRLYDFDTFEHNCSVSSDFWSVNSEFYSFLQNKFLNDMHTDVYTIYILYIVYIYIYICSVCVCMCVCVCVCVCVCLYIVYKQKTFRLLAII